MLVAIDTAYSDTSSATGGVIFESWESTEPVDILVSKLLNKPKPYQSGEFYKRELPCILYLLNKITHPLEYILIDANVFLDGTKKPGLGKHLFDALDQNTDIIGIAKNRYHLMPQKHAVIRGESIHPLYVTTTSNNLTSVKNNIALMAGDFRIPSMLKLADKISKDAL